MSVVRRQLSPLDGVFEELPRVGLPELVATADLQVRTDRKYLLRSADAAAFVNRYAGLVEAGPLAALEIDDMRAFRYESVYFDTPDLQSYLRHARGRRVRFKVRTRTYEDTGGTVLEVKQSGLGQTLKSRLEVGDDERTRISARGHDFIEGVLGDAVDVRALSPVLVTRYARSTILDRSTNSRLTIDQFLDFEDGDEVRSLPSELVVVETKSRGAATRLDKVLWRMRVRPESMSKFAMGLAATRPHLPANRWHRVLHRTGLRGACRTSA